MGKLIDLGREVEYRDLEQALTKAAEEVGWKLKIKDRFDEKKKEYVRTDVILRGFLRKKMEVSIFSKGLVSYFYVYFGDTMNGNAFKSQVNEYLGIVSEYLFKV